MTSHKRIALYARVSTGMQAREGFSLESQERMARDRCAVAGWTMPNLYQDVMSGRKDARPDLKRLMDDAGRGLIDVVLVYRLDRLGRSLVHTLQVVGELADLGVKVVSLTQPFEIDGSLGKLLLAIYASFAEMESEAIGARVRDTRRHLVVTQGKHYAVPPFGYVRIDGKMTPHEENAQHVRWMFEQVAAGRGLRSVVVDLNQRGVLTGAGKLWTIAGLKVVLSNPAYIGKITHGRKPVRRTSKGEVKRSMMPEGAFILADGDHEAIVSEADWTAVQRQMESRKGTAPRTAAAGDKHPWLAVSRCGVCGGRLATHKTRGYTQYSCARINHSGPQACTLPSIALRMLSGALVREMAKPLAEDVKVSSVQARKPKKGPATDRQKEIAKIEAAIRKEADLHRIGAQTLLETERRVKELRAQLDELAAYREVTPTPPPRIEDFVAMWQGLEAEPRAALIRTLVARVVVGHDTIQLTWRPEFEPYLGEGLTVPRPRLRGGAAAAFAID